MERGAHPTPVIDRFWFRSIYFREPSGVLFEIATLEPGFGVDEDPEHLGEKLILPPFLEHRREEIEQVLTPVTEPAERRARTGERFGPLVREPAGDAQGALVLNHGRGADENDLYRRCSTSSTRSGGSLGRHHRRAAHEHAARRAPLVHRAAGRLSRTRDVPLVLQALTGFLDGLLAERGLGWDRPSSGASRWAPSCPTRWAWARGGRCPPGSSRFSGFVPTVEGWQPELARPARAGGPHPPRRERPDHLGRVRAAGARAPAGRRDRARVPRDGRRPLAAGRRRSSARRALVARRGRLTVHGARGGAAGSAATLPAPRFRPPRVRTCVRAMGQPGERGRRAGACFPESGSSVVRTFDAPEALGINFHEVQARSAINAVPERSRMPFRLDDQPVSRLHPRLRLLLRAADAYVPGPRTPAATSSARSSSRSTCPSWCGPSSARRAGRASTSRSARTRTRTSGSSRDTG